MISHLFISSHFCTHTIVEGTETCKANTKHSSLKDFMAIKHRKYVIKRTCTSSNYNCAYL